MPVRQAHSDVSYRAMSDEEFGARNGVPGEHLVRLEATKVTTAKDVAD